MSAGSTSTPTPGALPPPDSRPPGRGRSPHEDVGAARCNRIDEPPLDRSSPARAIARKRSMYHCECPGSAATFCIQILVSTMLAVSTTTEMDQSAIRPGS